MRSEIFYNLLHPIKGREPARIDFTTGYCWMPFSETESYKVTTVDDKWHWVAKDGSIGPVAVPYEPLAPTAVDEQGLWKFLLGNWKPWLGEQENQGASVDDTIRDRGKTYGDFEKVAATAQALKEIVSLAPETEDHLTAVQWEALSHICTKIARLLHGDPNDVNSWHDIAGYATLAERSCKS